MRRPDPTRLYRAGLTRTFQQARVFPELTLRREPRRGRQRSPGGAARPRAGPRGPRARGELLEEFGARAARGPRAGELSFGQRKLLEFATVLMGRPQLVLLDEPTAGVNPMMVERWSGTSASCTLRA